MAVAARRIDDALPARVLPRLRIVPPSSARKKTRSSSPAVRAAAASAAYDAFVAVCIVSCVLALAAAGRVWLSAEAAEASIASSRLRQEIKVARFEGDMLEVQESRLGAPGRIEKNARAIGMERPRTVCYIDLRGAPAPKAPAPGPDSAKSPESGRQSVASHSTGLGALIDSAVGVAAGEARVLLVGDVGLQATR